MLHALPMLHSCSTYQRQVVDILYKNLVIYSEGLLTLKTPKVARANVMSRCKFSTDYPWAAEELASSWMMQTLGQIIHKLEETLMRRIFASLKYSGR